MDNYIEKKTETILTIGVAFFILSGILSWNYNSFIFWPLIISGIVLFFGFFVPKFGLVLTIFWFKLAHFAGWLSSKIILSILYFFFITPYSFLFNFFNKNDSLNKNPKESMFVVRDKRIEPQDFQNPW